MSTINYAGIAKFYEAECLSQFDHAAAEQRAEVMRGLNGPKDLIDGILAPHLHTDQEIIHSLLGDLEEAAPGKPRNAVKQKLIKAGMSREELERLAESMPEKAEPLPLQRKGEGKASKSKAREIEPMPMIDQSLRYSENGGTCISCGASERRHGAAMYELILRPFAAGQLRTLVFCSGCLLTLCDKVDEVVGRPEESGEAAA